jgi:hypothetical protein
MQFKEVRTQAPTENTADFSHQNQNNCASINTGNADNI